MQSHWAIWLAAWAHCPCSDGSIVTLPSRSAHVPYGGFRRRHGRNALCGAQRRHAKFDPTAVYEIIASEKITHALLVPAMIKMLLDHPNAATADMSSMEKIMYGASPMPAATLERCMELWPHIGLVQAYGQTELAPIATMLSPDDHRAGGQILKSAGRPTPINDVRVVSDEGDDCPVGESGEVVVRGPHTMMGYWNKPAETEKALKDGWVYTGDAGLLMKMAISTLSID